MTLARPRGGTPFGAAPDHSADLAPHTSHHALH